MVQLPADLDTVDEKWGGGGEVERGKKVPLRDEREINIHRFDVISKIRDIIVSKCRSRNMSAVFPDFLSNLSIRNTIRSLHICSTSTYSPLSQVRDKDLRDIQSYLTVSICVGLANFSPRPLLPLLSSQTLSSSVFTSAFASGRNRF